MATPDIGWAVGQRGLILRTEDGGKTWQRQPNHKEGEGSHLFSVAAIDGQTAVAVGEWGSRIRTTDGGKTWLDYSFLIDEAHPQFVWLSPLEKDRVRRGERVYEDVTLTDVNCLRAPGHKCWLIGEFGYIFWSEDAGQIWQRAKFAGTREIDPIELGFNEIEFSEANAEVLKNFGAPISDQLHLNIAIEAVASRSEVREFGTDDPSELFEMLEARVQEAIAVLESTGINSDRLRRRGQPPWDYEDFLDDDPEFLDRYLERQSHDYPGVKVRVIQNPYLFTVRFRDAERGLISGLGGVILRTSDGGATWEYREIDRKQALFSASATQDRALAVGEKGFISVSTDDGETWAAPPKGTFPDIFTFMRDVDFSPSGRVGMIVGQTGRIYLSTDAGYQWQQILGETTG
jgi:photosystem II stability/assembly factor-like uncharacterized protein